MIKQGVRLVDRSIKLTPRQLMDKRFPVVTAERYALISYLIDKKEEKKTEEETKENDGDACFVRIFGMYTTEREAEAVAREAIEQGYDYFDFSVIDTRGWLQFPPPKHERESQGDKRLQKAFGSHITNTCEEATRVHERARKGKVTNPLMTYSDKVHDEAIRLLQKMRGGKAAYHCLKDLEYSFKEYQKDMKDAMNKKHEEDMKNIDLDALCKGKANFNNS